MDGVPRLSPTMSSRKLLVLQFIEQYWAGRGSGPSISEVARAVNCARSRAQKLISKLVAEGRLHRIDGMERGVRPVNALEDALRQLRAAGYVVNEDICAIGAPDHAMRLPLIDLDAQGRVTVQPGWTNPPLPDARARTYLQRQAKDAGTFDDESGGGIAT